MTGLWQMKLMSPLAGQRGTVGQARTTVLTHPGGLYAQ